MLAPIRTKQAFAELSRRGRRGRSGPVWVRQASGPAGDDTIRVAFALPRQLGSAVVRNRIRRRLRELMSALGREGHLAGGSYLLGASKEAADLDFSQLRSHLERALEASR